MADQWEVCMASGENIQIFSPRGFEFYMAKEFVERYKKSYKKPLWMELISVILSEGWEPYGGNGSSLLFRRKYQD